jgi:hypothetical protein
MPFPLSIDWNMVRSAESISTFSKLEFLLRAEPRFKINVEYGSQSLGIHIRCILVWNILESGNPLTSVFIVFLGFFSKYDP